MTVHSSAGAPAGPLRRCPGCTNTVPVGHMRQTVGPAAPDVAEIEQLRAALAIADQRREDLRVELWKHIDVQERRAVRAEDDRDQLVAEVRRLEALKVVDVDELRRELDRWAAALVDANTRLAERRHVGNDPLSELLAERVNEAREERDAARADRDRLADLLEGTGACIAEPAPHRHAWDWQPGLKAMPIPCACGTPWPRVELLKARNTSADTGGTP